MGKKEDPFPDIKKEAPQEGWFPKTDTKDIRILTRVFIVLDEILLLLIGGWLLWQLNNWLGLF